MDRCANAFMATEGPHSSNQNNLQSSTAKESETKIPTPPSTPVRPGPKPIEIADISTPPNMTRLVAS